jgi:hypothetical protein
LDVRGKWLVTLNITVRPIANKYCEGKLKQNFEKRVKSVLEVVKRESIEHIYYVSQCE